MGGDEVLQHAQPFAEAAADGEVNDAAGRVGHQAAHAGHLADLRDVALCSAAGHQVDRAVGFYVVFDRLLDQVCGLCPDGDGGVVALLVCGQPHLILLLDLADPALGFFQQLCLLRWYAQIVHGDSDAGRGSVVEADALDGIDHLRRAFVSQAVVAIGHHLLHGLVVHHLVIESQLLRKDFVEDDATGRGLDELAIGAAVTHLDGGA